MVTKSHPQAYNKIGQGYRNRRQPDPRISEQIHLALGAASTVCNIGAGTGSYEPDDREVTAVEPSQIMIDQRTSNHPVVCASAENLPFSDNQFDVAMAVLTVHHWQDPVKGLAEMKRVSRRQVVLTFDLEFQDQLWLITEYLPEILELESKRVLSIEAVARSIGAQRIKNVLIPWDCTDGFQAAYWRRPHEYLKPDVQASISTLAQLPASTVSKAMDRLSHDLESGEWKKRHAALLSQETMDYGYRLIISENN